MTDEVLPPDNFPQYTPPHGVRQAHPDQQKPLFKLFKNMLRRGKYRSQTTRPRKKKTRVV